MHFVCFLVKYATQPKIYEGMTATRDTLFAISSLLIHVETSIR